MNRIKIISFCLLVTVSIFTVASNSNKEIDEALVVMCGVPTAPPALPLLKMIEERVMEPEVKLDYTLWTSPEQLVSMIQGGEGDMFALPLTVAAKLYNKGLDLQVTNVNTWGVTYFTTTDPDFKTWSDLKGKTVYIPLRSSPPDCLTQVFMENSGLDLAKDVEIIYSTQAEIANLMAAGKIEYATQIEPQCTMSMIKNPEIRSVISFTDSWQELKGVGTDQPNAGWAVRNKFIESNPELVVKFEKEYEKALKWVVSNPKEAAKLAEDKLNVPAVVFEKGIPRMGILYKNAQNSEEDCNQLFELLYSFSPKTVGGKIPDSGLYFNEAK